MKKRLAAVLFVGISLVPLAAAPANAGVVCGVADTIARKYLGPIHGHYGAIEEGLGEVCAITP